MDFLLITNRLNICLNHQFIIYYFVFGYLKASWPCTASATYST